MGLLIDGTWHDKSYETEKHGGRFVRWVSGFRNWVTPDGEAGPTGEAGFKAEAGRYHLYVADACPWAHRTMIVRALKGLEDMISFSVVSSIMREEGWTFDQETGSTGDHLFGFKYLREVYLKALPDMSGRVTVPILWDKKTNTIVSNESSEIIRMLSTAFDGIGAKPGDYYPEDLRTEIDPINERIYNTVNNGVYKSGFATSQSAYEEAVVPLFESLDWLEEHLSTRRYLLGGRLTEADIRLFTTLVRFDPVYHGHFKCNIRRIEDYPNLWAYTREIYQMDGVAETTNIQEIKTHYYASHDMVNPTLVVPLGNGGDLNAPHGRDHLSAA